VADNDAQTIGFLKNHLSGDLYTWMRAVAPAAEIEKLNFQLASLQAQLAQPAQVHLQNNETFAIFEKLNSKIASLEAQLAKSMQMHSKLAQCLQLPENPNSPNS
ncbi:hypothetical protein RhiirA1_487216, partial [Rhizophagus irregularis]